MLVPVTPLAARLKSAVPTPVTPSLNVTVHCALAAFVGETPTRSIDTTVGTVLSIVYACPLVKPPPIALPAVSWMPVPLAFRSSSIVPSPEPVSTVAVYVAPLPVTPVTDAPLTPETAGLKSLESTPVTLSLNVTVNWTLAALVGLAPTRLIDSTVGATASHATVLSADVDAVLLLPTGS